MHDKRKQKNKADGSCLYLITEFHSTNAVVGLYWQIEWQGGLQVKYKITII